jgi:hypothetical protein
MNQAHAPLTIVCGNSQKMIDIVYKVIDRIKLRIVTMDQYGVIKILKV